MGMFGKGLGAVDPSQLSKQDRLMLLGATLRDTGNALRGEDSDAVLKMHALMAQRQQEAAQKAFADQLQSKLGPQYADGPTPQVSLRTSTTPGMFGGAGVTQETAPAPDFTYQAPQRTSDGLNINSPDLPTLALQAQRLGVPLTNFLEVLKAQQPDVRFDRGFGYNGKTGAAMGGFHPDLDKGQGLDANGAVMNLPNAVQSAAEMAGAVEGAKAKAQAPYQFPTFTGPDGNPTTVSAATAAALGAKGGIIARGQSPTEASAAKIKGDATATASVLAPADLNNIDTAISTAKKLLNHPELAHRTGAYAMLPAIPGTKGVGFDALKKQVLGQIFLDAYGSLRGGGQITEIEGAKATQARARMEAAQTEEDFREATKDYIASLERARSLVTQKAGGAPSASGANISSIPVADRMAEARRRGLIP